MVQAIEEKSQTYFPERAQAGLGTVLANSVAVGAVRQPELGLSAKQIDSKASTVAEQVRASGALAGLSGMAQNAQSQDSPTWTSRITPGDKTPGSGRDGR